MSAVETPIAERAPSAPSAAQRKHEGPPPLLASRAALLPLGLLLVTSFPLSIALLFQWLYMERIIFPFAWTSAPAAASEVGLALVVDAALLLGFALPHSLLLRGAGQRLICRLVPRPLFYTVYGLVSALTLIAVTLLWRPIEGDVWRAEGLPGVILTIGFGLAWAGMGWSLHHYGPMKQPGIEQWWAFQRGVRLPSTGLPRTGPFRFTRHPIYISMLLMVWVVPVMTKSHLLLSLVWSAYLVLGAIHKEVRLKRTMRAVWDAYASDIPALPGLRGLTKLFTPR